MPVNKKTLAANIFLLSAAVIWGSTFVFQRHAMLYLSPTAYTGLRFLLAGFCLAPFAFLRARNRLAGSIAWGLTVRAWTTGGLTAGLLLCLGMVLQQYGLVSTTAGKAGFITGLYVVFVPLIGRFIGERVELGVFIGIVLAVAGLYLLSYTNDAGISEGDLFVLAGSLVWACHVLAIGWFSPQMDSVILATGQALVAGAVSLGLAYLLGEGPTLEGLRGELVWLDILWGGVLSVAVGFTLQIMGQKDAPPTAAAIIMQLEAVVAALAGCLFLSEVMTGRMIFGAALMFAGMLISQLHPLLMGQAGKGAAKRNEA